MNMKSPVIFFINSTYLTFTLVNGSSAVPLNYTISTKSNFSDSFEVGLQNLSVDFTKTYVSFEYRLIWI